MRPRPRAARDLDSDLDGDVNAAGDIAGDVDTDDAWEALALLHPERVGSGPPDQVRGRLPHTRPITQPACSAHLTAAERDMAAAATATRQERLRRALARRDRRSVPALPELARAVAASGQGARRTTLAGLGHDEHPNCDS